MLQLIYSIILQGILTKKQKIGKKYVKINNKYNQFLLFQRNKNNKFNMSDIQLPKSIRNVVRHQDIKEISNPINIFAHLNNISTQPNNINWNYDAVGDYEFKKKYQSGSNLDKINEPIDEFKTVQQTNLNSTFCNYTRIIQDGSIGRKLSKEKQLYLTRNRRTFSQFQSNKIREQSINKHLKMRLSNFGTRKIDNTMTFSKKQIQISPNPENIDLINDNIPEYWKNSLRDHQKRLKRHIKGNSYRKQVAQQMLQTLKGRKKLMSSIPKIRQYFFSPICSRHAQNKIKRSFNIKGHKIKQFSQDISQKHKALTLRLIAPKNQFEQVYKINYDSAHRWQGQLC